MLIKFMKMLTAKQILLVLRKRKGAILPDNASQYLFLNKSYKTINPGVLFRDLQ
jgi:hypothetical protein